MEYIAFDAHKHYTLASVARPDGQLVREQRIAHERGALQQFLERCERGSPVAVDLTQPLTGRWSRKAIVPRTIAPKDPALCRVGQRELEKPLDSARYLQSGCGKSVERTTFLMPIRSKTPLIGSSSRSTKTKHCRLKDSLGSFDKPRAETSPSHS